MKNDIRRYNEDGLAVDESGNVKSWKITYCGWLSKSMLLDDDEPYKTAYIVAHTALEAVEKLKEELRLYKCVVCGEPTLELISREEEYENS